MRESISSPEALPSEAELEAIAEEIDAAARREVLPEVGDPDATTKLEQILPCPEPPSTPLQ